ncbi:hypothetical protein PPS11_08970 [Pseudomonas putida S11]|nr:hypothetical protein PPS11_08970 [Pseudomonas putida S11]
MQRLAHAHGTVLVIVQALGQVLDALVTQRVTRCLLRSQFALPLAVVEEKTTGSAPRPAPGR